MIDTFMEAAFWVAVAVIVVQLAKWARDDWRNR